MKVIKQLLIKYIDEIMQNSGEYPREWVHVADTNSGTFYHLDADYNVWTCDCTLPVESRVSLCLSQCRHLKKEGEYNELKRKIAQARKTLGFLQSETLEEGYKRLLKEKNS